MLLFSLTHLGDMQYLKNCLLLCAAIVPRFFTKEFCMNANKNFASMTVPPQGGAKSVAL